MSAERDEPEAGEGRAESIRIARCPLCGKPREPAFRPFCSKRCADLDLSRWFNGVYAVPVRAEEEGEGE